MGKSKGRAGLLDWRRGWGSSRGAPCSSYFSTVQKYVTVLMTAWPYWCRLAHHRARFQGLLWSGISPLLRLHLLPSLLQPHWSSLSASTIPHSHRGVPKHSVSSADSLPPSLPQLTPIHPSHLYSDTDFLRKWPGFHEEGIPHPDAAQ